MDGREPKKAIYKQAHVDKYFQPSFYEVSVSVILQHKGNSVLGIIEKVTKYLIFCIFILCRFSSWTLSRQGN